MHRSIKVILLFVIALVAVLLLRPNPSAAGDIILTHNRGGENAVFFVNDEPSLVINGFDLSPHTTRFPIALDAVSISVDRPAPGSRIDLVVYQDANGGSPVDATLVHRQSVQINRSGVQRFILNEAAIITEPVAWVGFYLPVGFRFHADTSGPSVLTYWAWAPGGTFPLDNLASAPVLGPGDGAEPVSIDMQGVARITAELRPLFHQEMASDAVLGNQLIAEGEQDTSLLQGYPHCGGLLFDPEDIAITSRASFTVHCGVASEFDAPTEIVHPDGHFLDLQRAGHLYKLEAQIPQAQLVEGAVNVMPVPVTHCIQIQAGDLEQAVIAEARGIPERWHALPSVRFEDVVCAEITTASYLSYFLPRGADAPPNVNLVMGWTKVDPHPLECGLPAYVEAPVTNTGQSWFSTVSGSVKFIIENIHVRSGITTGAVELSIETSQLGPGMRHILVFAPIYVTTYVNELHRLQVRADFDNQIQETNENDNVWFTEYILSNAQQSDRCYDAPWLTATPTAPYLVEGFCFVDLPREVDDDGRILIRYSDSCQIDEFRQSAMTEQSGDWQQTVRGCDILVRTEVVGQELRVRWSNRGGCESGSTLRQYREKIELGGESVLQLVIDHDPPIPLPLQTATAIVAITQAAEATITPDSMISRPVPLSSVYDPVAKRISFTWSRSDGAAGYDFRYHRPGHGWIYPSSSPDSTRPEHIRLELPLSTPENVRVPAGVLRGIDYVWQVRGNAVAARKGPWSAEATFDQIPTLAAPEDLTVSNDRAVPFTTNLKVSWDAVAHADEYVLQWRKAGGEWQKIETANLETLVDVGADNKASRHDWRVWAKDAGGDGPPSELLNHRLSSSVIERDRQNAIDTAVRGLVQPQDLQLLTGGDGVRFIWLQVVGANFYEYRYGYTSDDSTWITRESDKPAMTATIQPSNGPAYHSATRDPGAGNVVARFYWQVRAIKNMGLGRRAEGPWSDVVNAVPVADVLSDVSVTPANLGPFGLSRTGRLSWSPARPANDYSYEVLYRETGNNNWNGIISVTSGTGADLTVTSGRDYEVFVRAVRRSNNRKGPWVTRTYQYRP